MLSAAMALDCVWASRKRAARALPIPMIMRTRYAPAPGVVGDWDTQVAGPPAARAAGVLSLALWTGVVACGRLLAYF